MESHNALWAAILRSSSSINARAPALEAQLLVCDSNRMQNIVVAHLHSWNKLNHGVHFHLQCNEVVVRRIVLVGKTDGWRTSRSLPVNKADKYCVGMRQAIASCRHWLCSRSAGRVQLHFGSDIGHSQCARQIRLDDYEGSYVSGRIVQIAIHFSCLCHRRALLSWSPDFLHLICNRVCDPASNRPFAPSFALAKGCPDFILMKEK